MKTDFQFSLEIIVSINNNKKIPNILANVYLKFKDNEGRQVSLNGSTLRKSQFEDKPFLVPASKSKGPGMGFYKFIFSDKSLWSEIRDNAVQEYEKQLNNESIPIIEERENGEYEITAEEGKLVKEF